MAEKGHPILPFHADFHPSILLLPSFHPSILLLPSFYSAILPCFHTSILPYQPHAVYCACAHSLTTPNSAEQRFLCSDGVQASARASGSVGSPNQGSERASKYRRCFSFYCQVYTASEINTLSTRFFIHLDTTSNTFVNVFQDILLLFVSCNSHILSLYLSHVVYKRSSFKQK